MKIEKLVSKLYWIKLCLVLLLIILSNYNELNSQVLISDFTGQPDSSSILEVRSTSKGLLPPRMTKIQRDLIVNPTSGLIIYCTDCLEMQMYNDTSWTNMMGLPPSDPPIPTITIGTQTWMEFNLDIGTMINGNTNMTNNSILEKYCYDDDPANCVTYGALYQWDEMMQYVTTEGTQGICPAGFHLPTDDEWKTLEMHLGMTQVEADEFGFRGTDEGSKLAGNELLWTNGELDLNGVFGSSGFTALPGGFRDPLSSSFDLLNEVTFFWSSTESGGDAYIRNLYYYNPRVFRGLGTKNRAWSVRCVQD